MFERREGEPLNLKQLWHAALGELQLGLTKANYDTWFKDTAIVSEEDDVYLVGVPNAFAREWLENKYRQQVRDALRHPVGRLGQLRRRLVRTGRRGRTNAGAPRCHGGGPAQRPLHVLDLRRRIEQPFGSRCGTVRRRAPRPQLQPALHLRWLRPREDASHARDRARRDLTSSEEA